jgi:1-acyl-sn-glycerol-3-phosphate acyltransferase
MLVQAVAAPLRLAFEFPTQDVDNNPSCLGRVSLVLRTLIMLVFWMAALPLAALTGFPWTFLTGDITFLYRFSMWGAFTGVRLAGVRVQPIGLEKIDPARTYIYMVNHVSNLDPPILLPLIPRRTSVMAKKELFSYPILGRAMRMGSLVPVDRGNRDAGIGAVREASAVLKQGISMTIFVEGKRSYDGKLLPFKKGPFYLAVENNVPVVPVTVLGTHYLMPKGRFSVKKGTAKIIFHDPIEPPSFGGREQLMIKVREAINSALPPEQQEQESFALPVTDQQERRQRAN